MMRHQYILTPLEEQGYIYKLDFEKGGYFIIKRDIIKFVSFTYMDKIKTVDTITRQFEYHLKKGEK